MKLMSLPVPRDWGTERLTTVEGLTLARDLIETYGWRQGSYGSPQVGFCSTGALRYALRYGDGEYVDWATYDRCYMALVNAMESPESLLMFNDLLSRRKSEIVNLFNRAIRTEETTP